MVRTVSTIRSVVFVALACSLLTGCGKVADFQNDKNMVVPDWYQCCYYDVSGGVWNTILVKSYVLHFIFWIGVACSAFTQPIKKLFAWKLGPMGDPMSVYCLGDPMSVYCLGLILPPILSVPLWVVGRIILSFFTSDYVPYDFLVFLMLLAEYALAGSILFAYLAGWLTRPTKIQAQIPQTDSAVAQAVSASRHAKVMRAMAKALFVAVASAIGTKLGGLIGGIIVFVISAGISTFFDTSSFGSEPTDNSSSHP